MSITFRIPPYEGRFEAGQYAVEGGSARTARQLQAELQRDTDRRIRLTVEYRPGPDSFALESLALWGADIVERILPADDAENTVY